MRRSEDNRAAGGLSASRLEALSDGIFAFAMTLLVLELKAPRFGHSPTPAELARGLGALWPQALCYAMSFVSLGTLWVAHRAVFHFIHRTDRSLLWINLLFLIFVTTIPFLTDLIGQYPTYTLPAALYGIDLILGVGTLYAIWRYATADRRLTSPDLSEDAVRAASRRILIGPVFYALAIGLAFANTWVSIAIYALVPIAYAFPSAIDRHWFHHPPGSELEPPGP